MKKTYLYLPLFLLVCLLFPSCKSKPTNEDFKKMIVEKLKLPSKSTTTILVSNIYAAQEIFQNNQDLKTQGYIVFDTISREDFKKNIRWITFTEKSKPFLSGSEFEETDEIPSGYGKANLTTIKQKVTINTMHFNKITGVIYDKDEKEATVEYELIVKDLTPFNNILKKKDRYEEGQTIAQSAKFLKYEDGWRIK